MDIDNDTDNMTTVSEAAPTFHSFDSARYTGTPLSKPTSHHPGTVIIAVFDRLRVRGSGSSGSGSGRGRMIAVVQEGILHVWVGHERSDAERVCPGRQRVVCIHGRPHTTYADGPGGDDGIVDTTREGGGRLVPRWRPGVKDRLPMPSHGDHIRLQVPSEVLLQRQRLSAFFLRKPDPVTMHPIGPCAQLRAPICPGTRFVRWGHYVTPSSPSVCTRELGRINVGIVPVLS